MLTKNKTCKKCKNSIDTTSILTQLAFSSMTYQIVIDGSSAIYCANCESFLGVFSDITDMPNTKNNTFVKVSQ